MNIICFVLFCFVLFCFVLFCFVLFCVKYTHNLVLLKAIKYTVFYYFHGNKCFTYSVRIAEGHTEHIIASTESTECSKCATVDCSLNGWFKCDCFRRYTSHENKTSTVEMLTKWPHQQWVIYHGTTT